MDKVHIQLGVIIVCWVLLLCVGCYYCVLGVIIVCWVLLLCVGCYYCVLGDYSSRDNTIPTSLFIWNKIFSPTAYKVSMN